MLAQIGKDLKARLSTVEKGYVSRALFGGLQMVLERRGDQWRLAIARIGRQPSQTEVEVITRDFALPPGVEWQWTIKQNRKLKVTFHVAEVTWIEHASPQPAPQ